MKARPVVLVDMDGVLADFDRATADYIAAHHPEITPLPRQNFYLRDDYSSNIDWQSAIDRLHASRGFFESLPPVAGALGGWQRIIELGYTPRICTSPFRSNQWCSQEKLAWVNRYLGREAASTAIIDKRKELYDGIALIDDRPLVQGADDATWQHILFDRPYNQHIETDYRLDSWTDDRLSQLLASCAARYR